MSNTVFIRANGPIIVRGKVKVVDAEENVLLEDNEAFLCRCGHSKNKPFCDGEHKSCGFHDDASFTDDKSVAPEDGDELLITVRKNAMLIAKGPMTIQNEDGSSTTTRNKAALCRCGESSKKPFCDASHKRCGFIDD